MNWGLTTFKPGGDASTATRGLALGTVAGGLTATRSDTAANANALPL